VVELLKKYLSRATPKESSAARSYDAADFFKNARSAERYYLRKEARQYFLEPGVVRINVLSDD